MYIIQGHQLIFSEKHTGTKAAYVCQLHAVLTGKLT